MFMKKILLITALIGAAAPMMAMQEQLEQVASYLETMSAEQIENDLVKVVAKLQPFAQSLLEKIQNGDYEGIVDTLALDLRPAVEFVHNNVDTIKGIIKTGLPAAVDRIQSTLPDNYRDQVNTTVSAVLNNLDKLSDLKSRLLDVMPYANLKEHKKVIAETLKTIATSPEGQKLITILREFASDAQKLVMLVKALDINTLRSAIKAAKEITQRRLTGQKIAIKDLNPIAKFLNELRTKLAPAIPMATATVTNYAIRLNDLAKQTAQRYNASLRLLPQEVFEAARFLQNQTRSLDTSIEKLNQLIEDAKNAGKAALGV